MSNQPEFPFLDYNNYEYYRVARSDLKEFKALKRSIERYTEKKKAIPKRTINQLFFLLSNVWEEEFLRYDVQRYMLSDQMVQNILDNDKLSTEFLMIKMQAGEDKNAKAKKRKYLYMYKYFHGFSRMIWDAVVYVKEMRKEKRKQFEKKECVEAAFKALVKYRKERMSIHEQQHYHGVYKLGALAAMITEKVFEIPVSDVQPETVKQYFSKVKDIINEIKDPELAKDF